MKFKNFATWALITAVALAGCKKGGENLESKAKRPIQSTSITKVINGNEYRFEGDKVTELSSDEDNIARYGVMPDIHG